MKWFRFYHEAYRNPKVQDMRPELFKFWVNFLCVASESEERGTVASEGHLRRALGMRRDALERLTSELEALNLLVRTSLGGLKPHDWDSLQPDSDDSAKRQRDKRARDCDKQQSEMSRDTSRDMFVTRTRASSLEGDREGEGEENPPLPPSISLSPEYTQLGEYAMQLGGDVSWGTWVSRQGMAGHKAEDIRAALDQASGSGKLTQPYVASILRGWAVEGRPKPSRNGHGNGPAPKPGVSAERMAELSRPVPRKINDRMSPRLRAESIAWNIEHGFPENGVIAS